MNIFFLCALFVRGNGGKERARTRWMSATLLGAPIGAHLGSRVRYESLGVLFFGLSSFVHEYLSIILSTV